MREVLVCAQMVTSAIGANDMETEQVETSRENATLLITQTFEISPSHRGREEDTVVRDGGHFTFQDSSSVSPEGTVSEDTSKEKHSLTRKLVGYRNWRQWWC